VASDLIAEQRLDLIALAEAEFSALDLQKCHYSKHKTTIYEIGPASNRIKFFSVFDSTLYRGLLDTNFVSFKEYRPPIGNSVLFAACHLRSKVSSRDLDQHERAMEIYRVLLDVEKNVGHSRTVFFGDFNMNPFETGLTGARAFHAVMDKRIAKRKSRKVGGVPRDFFYNPMWHLMGNREQNARGTTYFDNSDPHTPFWNTFDQVLVRPDLIDAFDDHALQIIESVGSRSLLTKGKSKISSKFSDHLPLVFKLHQI
jgi:hypothetical protein